MVVSTDLEWPLYQLAGSLRGRWTELETVGFGGGGDEWFSGGERSRSPQGSCSVPAKPTGSDGLSIPSALSPFSFQVFFSDGDVLLRPVVSPPLLLRNLFYRKLLHHPVYTDSVLRLRR